MSEETKVQKPPVLIDREDAEWFDKHYPSHGSWTWFVRSSLKKFRELHGTETPEDLIELGMRELLHMETE